ncbi:MAG: outer membrane lipid asymmetry maintenance protein MlaD [Desulfobulbaceae bacterium]|nr:outer membrane lipid asymmetry maintenance protein MlaD [Desulfobulbaceae bacterium]
MSRTTLDLWVGFFVSMGIVSMIFLALRVGNLGGSNLGESYQLKARFDNIGSLKVRSAVKSAGVVVGRVSAIDFDVETYEAEVTLTISDRYLFPTDTFAKIMTSGLLGEQYIGLAVGGDEKMLKRGDVISKTQSAIVIEDLISQFMFKKASEGDVQ